MKADNHTELDINVIAYGNCYWRNQHSQHNRLKPTRPTAYLSEFNPSDYAAYHHDYPKETLIERARRLDILDKWLFVAKFQLNNSHTIEFTGDKARDMWAMWKAKLYNKKRNKK